MAFFKEALNGRGRTGRAKGGNSASIRLRTFRSRATSAGVNFSFRKTRFQTLFAMSFSPFSLRFRNFIGSDRSHGILGNLLINDDDVTAIRRISPNGGELSGLA